MRAPFRHNLPIRRRDLAALALVGSFALAASGTHVVRSGETLSTIARQHGTTVSAIVEANDLANPNLIVIGSKLDIPGAAGAPSAPTTTTHVVARGDTLASIARRYGTTVAAIAKANGITDPNRIVIGKALEVTGSGPATSGSGGSGSGGSGSGGSGAPSPSPGTGSSTSTQRVGQRHTVAAGETIGSIARRYGITSADLIAWNGLVDGKIYATARLMLWNPGTLPGASAATGPVQHTVASGQTLSAIASRFGTTIRAILDANGLTDPNRIVVGQRLEIPGSSGGSGPRCPVPGGTFFNDWGFPRSGGRSHAGNDIFAPRGTPVRAPVAGWIDIATGSIGGKQFRLKGTDGTTWYGSHLDDFGATGNVSAGDVIGYVGDSGNARGSRTHLHFELHVGGSAVNPYPLLRATC